MLFNRSIRPERLTLLVSLGLVLFYNFPFWREMLRIVGPLDGQGVKLLLESFLLVTAFYNLVLSLFNWPYLGKPLIALLLLISSFITYFMNQYGVMIDVHMVQNAVQTDHKEVRDLLTGKMALFFIVLGVLPAWWVCRRQIQWRSPLREGGVRLLTLLVSAAVLLGIAFAAYQDFASLFRNNRQLRHYLTPFNYIQATNGYIQDHYFSGPVVISPLGEDAKTRCQLAAAQAQDSLRAGGGGNRPRRSFFTQWLPAQYQPETVGPARFDQPAQCPFLRHRNCRFGTLHVFRYRPRQL